MCPFISNYLDFFRYNMPYYSNETTSEAYIFCSDFENLKNILVKVNTKSLVTKHISVKVSHILNFNIFLILEFNYAI